MRASIWKLRAMKASIVRLDQISRPSKGGGGAAGGEGEGVGVRG